MNIYTNEFIKFIDKAEDELAKKYLELTASYGSDSMIVARNISIGDSNKFDDNQIVDVESHTFDISESLYFLSRKSEDEVIRMLCKLLKEDVDARVEKAFSDSDIKIVNLKDARKIMQIVVDTDIIIQPRNFTLSYRMGIGYRKVG